MKLVREWKLLLPSILLGIVISASCLASPTAPKLPSTLNYQPLNVVGVPTTEADWAFEMARLDMVVASGHLSGLRARNSDMVLLQYMLLHSVLVSDTTELNQLASIATARGKDIEEAFLHYYDDTTVTFSDGRVVTVKGYGGGTAPTLKDSRIKTLIWSDDRYIYNLKSPLVSELKGTQYRAVLTSTLRPDGIFVDENNPLQSFIERASVGGRIREYGNKNRDEAAAEYVVDVTAIYAAVNEAMGHDGPFGDRYLMPNIAEWVDVFLDLGLCAADGSATEILIQETQPRSPRFYDQAKQYADAGKLFLTTQGGYYPTVTGVGNHNSAMDRHQMYGLGEYWIAKQGLSTYYSQYPPDYIVLSQWWCKAREYDIGTAVDPLYSVWKTGTDSAGQNFTIYKRAYTKALVLSRPKVGWNYSDYATRSQLYDLGGKYRLLHYDGTLGPEITQIGLSMSEAVTLIKSDLPTDTTPPVISGIASSGIASSSATIAWTTSEATTGFVDYGATTAYGASAPAAVMGTSQSIALTGLSASTTYHYRVRAVDAAGNVATSADFTFTSSAGVPTDTTPPVVSSIVSSGMTSSSATVAWTTNEPTTGFVDYGTTTAYGTSVPASGLTTSKSIALTGLLASTTYHYRVRAVDAASNSATSPDLTFTTLAGVGGAPSISVTITVNKQTALPGEQLDYTVTYTNTGNGTAASAIVTADVDSHATFVSATNSGVYDATARVVRWTVGTVLAGASASVHYTVTVN